MRLYWTTRSIPEIAHLPAGERGRLYQRHMWKVCQHWQAWLALVPHLTMIAAFVAAGFSEDKSRKYPLLALAMAASVGGCLTTTAAWNHLIRRYLQQELGPTHCLQCGYDLRATPGRCPECGAAATRAGT
jgi:hypothetical protein